MAAANVAEGEHLFLLANSDVPLELRLHVREAAACERPRCEPALQLQISRAVWRRGLGLPCFTHIFCMLVALQERGRG